jgi:hypothetical protein
MQTWVVHTRDPRKLGPIGGLMLQATLGVAILAAMLHAPLLAWTLAQLTLWAAGGEVPKVAWYDIALLGSGWAAAAVLLAKGAARAGIAFGVKDALAAPVYWTLQTLAWVYAIEQLFTRPYHWDKTEHAPAVLHAAP